MSFPSFKERVAELQSELDTINAVLRRVDTSTPVDEIVRLQTRGAALNYLIETAAPREESQQQADHNLEVEKERRANAKAWGKKEESIPLRARRAELEAQLARVDSDGAGTPPDLRSRMNRLNTDAGGAIMHYREEVKRGIRHEIAQVDDQLQELGE